MAKHTHFRLIGSFVATFNPANDQLLLMNTGAGYLAMELSDKFCSVDEAVGLFADAVGQSPGEVRADVEMLLRNWGDQNLLRLGENGTLSFHPSLSLNDVDARATPITISDSTILLEKHLSLGSRAMSVRVRGVCDSGWQEQLDRLGALLDGFSPVSSTSEPVLIERHLDFALEPASIYENILTSIFEIAYDQQNWFVRLHAAGMAYGEAAVLLPAISGSGKTTLSGYLSQNSWKYGGDDTLGIGLSQRKTSAPVLLPFPTALSVKTESQPILEPFFPKIQTYREFSYLNKLARYQPVPVINHIMPKAYPELKAIVFPKFEHGAKLQVEEMSSDMALTLLSHDGVYFNAADKPGSFDRFIDLVNDLPTYTMRYSNLSDANSCLKGLLNA